MLITITIIFQNLTVMMIAKNYNDNNEDEDVINDFYPTRPNGMSQKKC